MLLARKITNAKWKRQDDTGMLPVSSGQDRSY